MSNLSGVNRFEKQAKSPALALALHEITGAPMGAIGRSFTDTINGEQAVEFSRAVVMVGNNRYVDCQGVHQFSPADLSEAFVNPSDKDIQLYSGISSKDELASKFGDVDADTYMASVEFVLANGLDVLVAEQIKSNAISNSPGF